MNAKNAVSDDEEGSDEEDDDEDEDMDEDEDIQAGPSTAGPSKPRLTKSTAVAADDAEDDEMDGSAPTDDAQAEAEETPAAPAYSPPPRIMITTSPSPCKDTYDFCEDLRAIFPGGEFFKRPKGKGFEIGRIGRWAAKRGYGAVLVVNENHKIPSEWLVLLLYGDEGRLPNSNGGRLGAARIRKQGPRGGYIRSAMTAEC